MTEIVKASLENGIQKSVSELKKVIIQPIFSFQKGIRLRLPSATAPSNCYKGNPFEEEGILEPIGVDEDNLFSELGEHAFSCGMVLKGSYTVVGKTRKSLSFATFLDY